MDDGLFAVAELVFLLDDGGSISRLTLLDDRGPVTLGRTIFMGLADRHAGADGTDMHADVIGERRRRDRGHKRRSEQIALHVSPPIWQLPEHEEHRAAVSVPG